MIAAPLQMPRHRLSARRRRWISPDLWATAVFVAMAFLLVAPALRSGYALVPFDVLSTVAPWDRVIPGPPQNTILSDPVFVAYPFRQHLADSLNGGHLALWNPSILAGHPSLGDPEAETFYPITWLFVSLLPLPVTFGLDAWLHLALAGILMYAFLRAMRLAPLAASVGGLIWMLNSNRVAWLTFPALTHTAAWMPGVFWGYERCLQRRRGGLALGAGCLGMMLLASWIQFTLYALLLLALYAGWSWWEMRRHAEGQSSWRAVGAAAGIVVLGTMLGAVGLLPLVEFARLSHRDVFDLTTLLATRLPWRALLTLAAPRFFGTHLSGQYYWGPGNYNECVAFFGAPGLLLAAIAPWVDRRARCFWLIAALLLLAVLLGTPLARLLGLVPVMNRFSLSRLLFLVPFLGGVLAALGFDAVWRGGKCLAAARGVGLAGSGLVVAALSLAAVLAIRSMRAQAPVSWQQLAIAFGFWLATGLACYLAARPAAARLSYARAIPPRLAVNLLAMGWGLNPAVAERFAYPRRPVLDALYAASDGGRVMPLHAARRVAMGPDVSVLLGMREADGYASLILKSYREFVGLMQDRVRYQPMRENLNMVAFSDYHPRLMDYLNVRVFAAAEPLSQERGNGLEEVGRGDGLTLYRNPQAFPRAFLVRDAELHAAQEERLARLADPTLDLSRTVILSAPTPRAETTLAAAPWVPRPHSWRRPSRRRRMSAHDGPVLRNHLRQRSLAEAALDATSLQLGAPQARLAGAVAVSGEDNSMRRRPAWPGSAELLDDQDTSVTIGVSALVACYLTASDAYYPGWQARVDGRPATLLRANHAFRAVAVPAGDHQVEFRFEPSSLRCGLFLSLLAVALAGAGLAATAGRATSRP